MPRSPNPVWHWSAKPAVFDLGGSNPPLGVKKETFGVVKRFKRFYEIITERVDGLARLRHRLDE